MMWVRFLVSAVVIVLAAIKLASYGDVISLRTRLGGMFVGTLLLSTATSLPELLTTISAIDQTAPGLAVGNLFGSSMFTILDILNRRIHILRSVAITHTLTGSLAVLLTALAVFFMLGDFPYAIGWVGVDSLAIMAIYIFGVQLIRISNRSGAPPPEPTPRELAGVAPLWQGIAGFAVATLVLMAITPMLVGSALEIAEVTGLGAGFVGTTLVALVTSLPELTTTISATRIGAYDLAVGNLFGSNMFNVFALAISDLFFTGGRFMTAINPRLADVGVMALMLTTLGMIGILAHIERRRYMVIINVLLIVGYLAGMLILY
jgi:cation:H+ antiporter